MIHLGGDSSNIETDYRIADNGRLLIIDAVDDAIDTVQSFVRKKLIAYGCETKALYQIRLAVEEIFVNIISYAYRPEVGMAEIFCEVTEDPLMVNINFMDSGKPFDPLSVEADTSGKMFLEKEGGFGIHLVKKTMDSVDYEYKDGKNVLKIKKNLKVH